jgi:hypothetical protein
LRRDHPRAQDKNLMETKMPADQKALKRGIIILILVASALVILFQMEFTRFQNRLDESLERLDAKIESMKRVIDQKK